MNTRTSHIGAHLAQLIQKERQGSNRVLGRKLTQASNRVLGRKLAHR